MITIITILLLLFRADSIALGTARLTWQQPAGVHLTCISRNTTLIRCWNDLPPGRVAITLGGSQTDAAYRPATGDVFTLALDGDRRSAALRSRPAGPSVQRLPLIAR